MSYPLAWAFEKDSEFVSIFNYHIQKMQLSGIMARYWQEVERKLNINIDDTKIQNVIVLGYENVAFPFLALLTGLFAALLQFGIEVAVFCKRKYGDNVNQSTRILIVSSHESSTHREESLVIKELMEVCSMLQENNSNQNTLVKVQSKMIRAREEINRLLQETNSK